MKATHQGSCLDSNGNPSTGMKELRDGRGQTADACLELCLEHDDAPDDATGCQYRESLERCWTYTGEVAAGNGGYGSNFCWKLGPAN